MVKMATGFYSERDKKWVWEPVSWRVGGDGLYYSNRVISKEFWKQNWDKPETNCRAGVVMVKYDKKGDLYFWVVQNYHNLFGFPKGRAEGKETARECAEREFYEETGTRISLEKSIQLSHYQGGDELHFFVVMVDEDFDIEKKPISDHEVTAFGWINSKNLYRYRLSGLTKRILETYNKSPHTGY